MGRPSGPRQILVFQERFKRVKLRKKHRKGFTLDQVALIALGANQPSFAGSPAETLHAALAALETADGLNLRAVSRLYRTPAFPPGAGPDYVNAAAAFDCNLAPHDLLTLLHGIENEHARSRESRWGARTLDLDLLALDGKILPSLLTWRHWYELPLAAQAQTAPHELVLPHPRLQDRAFVLVPLAEIAPDWRHPVLDRTVSEMLNALPDHEISAVTAL